MATIKVRNCAFCEEEFKLTGDPRRITCDDHQYLVEHYVNYRNASKRGGLYIMDRPRWFEYITGTMDMLCKCVMCKEFFEITKEEYKQGIPNRRRLCDECQNEYNFLRDDEKRAFNYEWRRNKGQNILDHRFHILDPDYADFPKEWGVAEFMATLDKNGKRARDFLKKRGYVVDVMPKGYRRGSSSVYANAIVNK